MCVLMIGWQLRSDPYLVVAANRDEARQRLASSPQAERWGARRVLLPRDRQAGGTWLGVNDAGLALAITNRVDGHQDPARPSRGHLTMAALRLDSAAAVRRMLVKRLGEKQFNSFNLFCADKGHAWVASWNGELTFVDLAPGAYVLTNAHGLDELPVSEFHSLAWSTAPWEQLLGSLMLLLGNHDGRDDNDYPLCKHGSHYGTVSSTLFHSRPQGGWKMHFSSGNPCTAPFVQYHLEGDDFVSGAPPKPGV